LKEIRQAQQILTSFQGRSDTRLRLFLNRRLACLPPECRAAVTRLVYGVIREQEALDALIEARTSRGELRVSTAGRTLLRIGAFILRHTPGKPEYAVVNEVVDAARQRERGFINALMRRLARDRGGLTAEIAAISDPARRHSLSPLLVAELARLVEDPASLLKRFDREPVFHLRVHGGRARDGEIEAELNDLGCGFRRLDRFPCYEIDDPATVLQRIVEPGRGYLQNTASQLISLIAAGRARTGLFDACAAPGTKSLTAHLARPDLRIVASDLNPRRLRLLDRFLDPRDAGLQRLATDITAPGLRPDRLAPFDTVLVDAPCSAAGTLRKNPDLKLKIDAGTVADRAEGQRTILEAALRLFPGAVVIYAVCTFTEAETEGVVDAVAGHGCEVLSGEAAGTLERLGFSHRAGRYGLTLLPDEDLQNDMFYIALLRRS